MSDYECPRCKTDYAADGCHEDIAGEHECDNCGFKVLVEIEYTPSYETECVDHSFGERTTLRDGRSAVFCAYCGALKADSVEVPE